MFRLGHGFRPFLYLVFLPVFLVNRLPEAEAADTKKQEEKIRSVIQQQLDAFSHNDYDAAYQFASRHIRTKFTRAEFEEMVKGGYPQIAKSSRAMFGKVDFSDENRASVSVTITGLDRVTVLAAYRMTREDEIWKIDGVM